MKSLMGTQFAPITFGLGFLDAPLADIVEFLVAWYKSLSKTVSVIQVKSRLPESLPLLEPLMSVRTKELLLNTRSTWTACFDNGRIGSGPATLLRYGSSQLKCRGLLVSCSPNTMSRSSLRGHGNYGAVMFELLGPREYPNTDRAIWLANDGGRWTFGTSGDVQSFEQPERYESKKKLDRFNSEMLEQYCRALGIGLFDEAFYGPEGVLLAIDEPQPPGSVPISLAEAQAKLDLDKIGSALR